MRVSRQGADYIVEHNGESLTTRPAGQGIVEVNYRDLVLAVLPDGQSGQWIYDIRSQANDRRPPNFRNASGGRYATVEAALMIGIAHIDSAL